jgi:hypothetical protein
LPAFATGGGDAGIRNGFVSVAAIGEPESPFGPWSPRGPRFPRSPFGSQHRRHRQFWFAPDETQLDADVDGLLFFSPGGWRPLSAPLARRMKKIFFSRSSVYWFQHDGKMSLGKNAQTANLKSRQTFGLVQTSHSLCRRDTVDVMRSI